MRGLTCFLSLFCLFSAIFFCGCTVAAQAEPVAAGTAIVIAATAELPQLDQVALLEAKQPEGVECKIVNGQKVCTLRTRTVEHTVQPIATRAADCKCVDCTCAQVAGVALDRECEPRFNGPVARSVRASGNAARAVGWRITHPFGGRFRR